MALKRQHRDAGGEGQRLRRRRHGAARQVDRPDRADLRVQERQAEGAPTFSTPRSCRRRPTARRTDARDCGGAAVSAFVTLDGVSHTYPAARPAARSRSRACRSRSRRRVRRRGRPVRLRQVHPDEACDRPAVPVQGHGAGRGRGGRPAGQDRRHGVPGADAAAVAHDARQPAAAARDRRSRIAAKSAAASAEYVARAEDAARLGRACAARATNFPGNCPAACSSAPRSAAR